MVGSYLRLFVLLALLALAAYGWCQVNSFTYATPDGITLGVTARGLSSVRVGGRQVASGGWELQHADGYFGSNSGTLGTGKFLKQNMEVLDKNRVRVRHEQEHLVTTYDYVFSGADVTITARVENNSETTELQSLCFTGLTVTFATPPTGLLHTWSRAEVQKLGLDACHPSSVNPIGGSYAVDKNFGIGLCPLLNGIIRSLWLWEAAGTKVTATVRTLSFLLPLSIPAEGARTLQMQMRFSKNTAGRYLLQPYKDYFEKNYGAVRYQLDQRPIAYLAVPSALSKVSPDNPYGFADASMRLDQMDSAKALAIKLAGTLAAGNAQGVIIKGWGGYDTRGTDFAVGLLQTPREVEAAMPGMKTIFDEKSLRLGAVTQPNGYDVRTTWTNSAIIRLSPRSNDQLDNWVEQLNNRLKMGIALFLFDNFGGNLSDVLAMKYYREKLPQLSCYSTLMSDVLLLYSPGVTSLRYNAATKRYATGINSPEYDILRWLLPQATFAVRVDATVPPTGGKESAFEFCFRNHLTPIVPMSNMTPTLRAFTTKYLDQQGHWLPAQ